MATPENVSSIESKYPYLGNLTIRPTRDLTAEQRRVERELSEIVQNLPSADLQYDQVNGTHGGRIINIDYYRCLHPLYGGGDPATLRMRRTQFTPATYAPAKKAAQDRFRRSLLSPECDVIIMGGGPASGKSTAVAAFLSKGGSNLNTPTLTYDTSLADSQEACQDIEEVLRRQGKVTIYWVYRPFKLAMGSMIQRALHDGRYLTARRLAVTHQGSRESISRILKAFGNDARVASYVIDNSGTLDDIRLMDLAQLDGVLYDSAGEVTRDVGLAVLKNQAQACQIPKDLYDAIAL